jgi:putative FmdB family regulatory protein
MPTYEYRCPSCGHEFEKVLKMTSKAKPNCPKCGKRAERMMSTGVGFAFKGTGFYATDYKRAGEPKTDAAEKTEKKPDKPEKAPEKSNPTDTSSKPPKASGAES